MNDTEKLINYEPGNGSCLITHTSLGHYNIYKMRICLYTGPWVKLKYSLCKVHSSILVIYFATLEIFIWSGFQYTFVGEKYVWKEIDQKNQNYNLIQVIISFIIFIDLFPVSWYTHSVYSSYFMLSWVLIMKFSYNYEDAKLQEKSVQV